MNKFTFFLHILQRPDAINTFQIRVKRENYLNAMERKRRRGEGRGKRRRHVEQKVATKNGGIQTIHIRRRGANQSITGPKVEDDGICNGEEGWRERDNGGTF